MNSPFLIILQDMGSDRKNRGSSVSGSMATPILSGLKRILQPLHYFQATTFEAVKAADSSGLARITYDVKCNVRHL